jgi:hypothetical protein
VSAWDHRQIVEGTHRAVQIVYLDQNKWIDLSRAVKYPADYPELRTVLEVLIEEAKAGRLVVPLTQTNIYETHKINDPQRRYDLAHVQVTLSQGRIFRGRHKRLETEVTDVLRGAYGLEPAEHAPQWFLSNIFFEATLEWKDPRLVPISERVMEAIKKEPPRYLFEYLMLTPELPPNALEITAEALCRAGGKWTATRKDEKQFEWKERCDDGWPKYALRNAGAVRKMIQGRIVAVNGPHAYGPKLYEALRVTKRKVAQMKTTLTLPDDKTAALLCIAEKFHPILNFLNAVRSGAKTDDSESARTYHNMVPIYASQLAGLVATEVPDADAIIAAPSSRTDVDPYRAAIVRRSSGLLDLSSSMTRSGSVKAADNETTLEQVIESFSYKATGKEGSLNSLVIVDETVGRGKTVAAMLHHLRAAGLPEDCKVTVVVALANN